MRSVSQELFPAKFLCLIGHMFMIIVIYFAKEDNIFAGISYSAVKYDSEYKLASESILAALSLSIIFLVFELSVLLVGVTMLQPSVTITSIAFHCLGIIFLIWYFLLSWRYQVIWAIWIFTCIIPFTVELFTLILFKIFYATKN